MKCILNVRESQNNFLKNVGNWDLCSIADNIYQRIEDSENDDIEEAIIEALNDEVIYYSEQWDILKAYCSPTDADWQQAIDDFLNDLIDNAIYDYEEEEEEEEEKEN